MNERDNIINFLLMECDKKNRTIQDLQAHQAELHRQIEALTTKQAEAPAESAGKPNGVAHDAVRE